MFFACRSLAAALLSRRYAGRYRSISYSRRPLWFQWSTFPGTEDGCQHQKVSSRTSLDPDLLPWTAFDHDQQNSIAYCYFTEATDLDSIIDRKYTSKEWVQRQSKTHRFRCLQSAGSVGNEFSDLVRTRFIQQWAHGAEQFVHYRPSLALIQQQ